MNPIIDDGEKIDLYPANHESKHYENSTNPFSDLRHLQTFDSRKA